MRRHIVGRAEPDAEAPRQQRTEQSADGEREDQQDAAATAPEEDPGRAERAERQAEQGEGAVRADRALALGVLEEDGLAVGDQRDAGGQPEPQQAERDAQGRDRDRDDRGVAQISPAA
nr:hypothetical protein [Streptomyces tsukubensis NRRL18488]